MFRLSVFFYGGADEAEELAEAFADLMLDATALERDRERLGYVVTLAAIDEPYDDDDFVALLMQGAYLALLGPKPDDV
jgi:hypothetical protein